MVRSIPITWVPGAGIEVEASLIKPDRGVRVERTVPSTLPGMPDTLRGDYYSTGDDLTGMPVFAVGAQSNTMAGTIVKCDSVVAIGIDSLRDVFARFSGVYEVEGTQPTAYFAQPGDSGGPVFDAKGKIVGVVVGRDRDEGASKRRTFVEPIEPILKGLDISIVGPRT